MVDEKPTDVVYALTASPAFAQDRLCFAARQSGLYRSSDGGATWQPAYDSLGLEADLPTMAVALSPDFSADRTVFAGVPGGVLRSTDGGATWGVVQLPDPPPLVTALALSPDYRRDGMLFAATLEDGVFTSLDRGGRWVSWNFGLLDLNVLSIAISPAFGEDETLYVGTESGIFRSTNGGRAWREVDFSPDWAPVLSLALSPAYATDGTIFAGTEAQGLFRSEDRGRSWDRLVIAADGEGLNSILLSPNFAAQPDVLALLGDKPLISRDGGANWSPWKADLPQDRQATAVVAPEGLDRGAPLLVGFVEGDVLRL